MILIIDNYDSFTYNLYQMIGQIQEDILVKRNDEITVDEIKELRPQGIIISPGPGNPENVGDFGVCMQVIKELGPEIPVLGVCLGHQGIFSAFGGKIILTEPVHGKQSKIIHNGKGVFNGVENPLKAARYHSLLCDAETTPECIEIIAKTDEGLIMAIKHREFPIYGLQFHPESVGTKEGLRILKNFLETSP
ncbi:anthranilate synthase component II [Methanobacterium congolense]|uniref:anthranilate synthase n=1 Tax=Methanobacterium congolense TaxID=118062 RepID=A0A1D3L0U8_9EURY|nr:aminodeoxychorismate/anthranilate synthase component II [Methanobacterium congolense]SCG85173.1 Anthranilate synthase component 2 [Methanobacterium congolense]